MFKRILPRRLIAAVFGTAIICNLVLPPAAWADSDEGSCGPAQIDCGTGKVFASQDPPHTVVLPNATKTLTGEGTVTISTTDVGTTAPSASGIPVAGTNSKIAVGWLPTSVITQTGTGSANYVPKFSGASSLVNSQIRDDGTNVGVGLAPTRGKVHVDGGLVSGVPVTSQVRGLGIKQSANSVLNGILFEEADSTNNGGIFHDGTSLTLREGGLNALQVDGNGTTITMRGNLLSETNGAYTLGSTTKAWKQLVLKDTNTNIKMIDTILTAGLRTSVGGRILEFGSNYSQLGDNNVTYAGGMFRIDLRDDVPDQLFSVLYQAPTTGAESSPFKLSRTGDIVALGKITSTNAFAITGGTFGTGTATTTTLGTATMTINVASPTVTAGAGMALDIGTATGTAMLGSYMTGSNTGTGTGTCTAGSGNTSVGTATRTTTSTLTGTFTAATTFTATNTLSQTVTAIVDFATGSATVTSTDSRFSTATATAISSGFTATGTVTWTASETYTGAGTFTRTTTASGTKTVTATEGNHILASDGGTFTVTGTSAVVAHALLTATATTSRILTATSASVATAKIANATPTAGGDIFFSDVGDSRYATDYPLACGGESGTGIDLAVSPTAGAPAYFELPFWSLGYQFMSAKHAYITEGNYFANVWLKSTSAAYVSVTVSKVALAFNGEYTDYITTPVYTFPAISIPGDSTWRQYNMQQWLPGMRARTLAVTLVAHTDSGTPTVTLGLNGADCKQSSFNWPLNLYTDD